MGDQLHATERPGTSAALIDTDVIHVQTVWTCEKWEQDKVDFVIAQLKQRGDVGVLHRVSGREMLRPFEDGVPSDILKLFDVPSDEIVVVPSNLHLNEGLQRLGDLLIAAGGTAYNNANAFIGVGDSTTAEAATQTDLSAAANHFYKGMNAGQPTRTNQTITWASDFTTSEANYAWQEWSVTAGATGVSGAGFTTGTTNLNRKVASLGTKVTGTWTLTSQITYS